MEQSQQFQIPGHEEKALNTTGLIDGDQIDLRMGRKDLKPAMTPEMRAAMGAAVNSMTQTVEVPKSIFETIPTNSYETVAMSGLKSATMRQEEFGLTP
jgi:hypothetical protein